VKLIKMVLGYALPKPEFRGGGNDMPPPLLLDPISDPYPSDSIIITIIQIRGLQSYDPSDPTDPLSPII